VEHDPIGVPPPAGGGDVPSLHDGPSVRAQGTRNAILLAIALVSIIFAVYWRVGDHQFIDFDDADYVTANPRVATGITVPNVVWAFTAVHSSNWHPLTWLSLMADAQLYGMDPRGYHLTNVLIHAAAAVLLLLLLYRLTGCLWRSAFVAALFALHPLHVESVAWVAERKDVLSALFCFLTLLLYSAYATQQGKTLYRLTLLSFALGLMAKPMLVTLPIIMLLLDVWPLDRYRPGGGVPLVSLIREKTSFFALSFLSALITVYAQHMGRAMNRVSFELGIENAILAYAKYLAKALWPRDLAIFYPLPVSIPLWQALGVLAGLALVSLATLRAVRKRPYLAVGWFWYLVTLVPVIGLIPVGEQSIADRYTYIPLTGIFIIIAWGVPELVRNLRFRRGLLAVLAVGWLTVLGIETWRQLGLWRDSVTLFGRTLQLSPDSHTAHTMMGNALANKGDAAAAIKAYQKALALRPDYAKARRNWALVHFKNGIDLANTGDLEGAIEAFLEATRIDPEFIEATENLAITHNGHGNALANKGDLDGAIRHYREAFSLAPNFSDAHNNLGIALVKKGDLAAAIQAFENALTIDPKSAEARNNLEMARARSEGR